MEYRGQKTLPVVEPRDLVMMDRANQLLAQCDTVEQAKELADKAAAATHYAKKAKLGLQAQNRAARIKVAAERRAGQLLGQVERGRGGAGTHQRNSSSAGRVSPYTTALNEAGASRQEANRWQKMAEMDEGKFSAILNKTEETGQEITTGGILKIAAKEKKEETRQAKILKLANKTDRVDETAGLSPPYPVIYADPPWRYDDNSTDPTRVIENHYPTMPLAEICSLEVCGGSVADLATDDAILFLWATSPLLHKAVAVISAWGFNYKTCAVWDKGQIGMGYFFRQQHELLLVAERGSIPKPAPADRPSSVICEPRGRHSQKPDRFYEIIETMYPTLSKVELFQRSPRAGWDGWGNEVGDNERF